MVNKSDFSLKLLSTLAGYASAEGDDAEVNSPDRARLFMKAALALRAWYRHMALRERPEMVVQERGPRFEVYGGTFIERQSDGTLKLGNEGRPENGIYVEVASLGQWLARHARQQVQLHYHAKAQDLIRSQELDANTTRQLISALEKANDYVGYKLNVAWWRPKSTPACDGRVLGKLLWDSEVLDRQVFSLAVRVAGFKFTVPAFNQCAQHRDALAARVKEAPHMAPWLVETTYDFTLRVQETVWKDLKNQFILEGGTPQAWKWLSNQGYNWFRLFRLDKRDIRAVNQLATLQLGKAPLHIGLMSSLRSTLGSDYFKNKSPYLDVFKAAVVAFKQGKLKMADFSDYNLIFDYLQRSPAVSTKGATWASLMRKQHVWHMQFAREEMERRREAGGCLGWVPFVQTLAAGDLVAVSLNDSDELWEEGAAMDHCVGGYDEQCYRNVSRIYSIRRGDERVATLEIRRYEGKLTIGQLYGFHNRKVKDESVTKFAKKVLLTCKRMPEPDLSANTVIREPKKQQQQRWLEQPVAPQPAEQPQAQQFAHAEGDDSNEIPF